MQLLKDLIDKPKFSFEDIFEKEVRKYILENREHLQKVKTCFEEYSLSDAIEKAAKAEDPIHKGKMFSHQRRVGKEKTTLGYELLKDKEANFKKCKSFEEIMVITDDAMKGVAKLGPLWSYDTALRIGFKREIYPTDVYMQAGVVNGYVKLFNKKPIGRKVAKSEFLMLTGLEAFEIENFLCIWGKGNSSMKKC